MNQLKISVVIPSYNESEHLEKCLSALVVQDLPLHEIIVVDNNSSDDSIKKAKAKFGNVIFISEPRQGIVFGRKTGFQKASGDIIAKIDADTHVDKNWSRIIADDYAASKFDGWSGYVRTKEINRLLRPPVNFSFNFFNFRVGHLLIGGGFLLGCNYALTRLAWDKLEPELTMRNDLWEDLDVSCWASRNQMTIHTHRAQVASISARSANVGVKKFFKRVYGQSKVYLVHKKYISYLTSLFIIALEFLVWLSLKPLSMTGKKIGHRPNHDQI